MSALDAAVTLAEISGWSLSNLQIQKLLYLCQMEHMGRNEGQPIFDDDFEAWKLGPVVPSVYQRAKMFGSRRVETFFHKGKLPDGPAASLVRSVYSRLPDKSPWRLVSMTHWDGGAWAKNYSANEYGCLIPKADIFTEYNAREAA